MDFYSVKNWEEFQHYKDRNPPWIKLHNRLLADYEFSCLQDASKAHLMLIWLLASQLENKIPADEKWIKEKIGAKEKINIKELVEHGFIVLVQDASKPLAKCSPETEAYRIEEKKDISQEKSEDFWKKWPVERRKEKPNFLKAWREAIKKSPPDEILAGLEKYLKTKEAVDGFAPYPAKWLKQERWLEDTADPEKVASPEFRAKALRWKRDRGVPLSASEQTELESYGATA